MVFFADWYRGTWSRGGKASVYGSPPFVEVDGIMTDGIRTLPYPKHPVVPALSDVSRHVDSCVRVIMAPRSANQSVPDSEGRLECLFPLVHESLDVLWTRNLPSHPLSHDNYVIYLVVAPYLLADSKRTIPFFNDW